MGLGNPSTLALMTQRISVCTKLANVLARKTEKLCFCHSNRDISPNPNPNDFEEKKVSI